MRFDTKTKIGISMLALLTAVNARALDVKSMSLAKGDAEGKLSALAKAGENKVVKLYSDRRGHLDAQFTVDGASAGGSYVVEARFRHKRAADVFTFQLQNAGGAFQDIGKSGSGTAFASLKFNVKAAASSLRLRLVSASGASDAELDQLVVSAAGGTPPPPKPTPDPDPEPQPPTPPQPGDITGIPAGSTWYWQLQGAIKTTVNVAVYDLDLFDTSAATIASLKAQGRAVVCYFSAGTYENWRPDASSFTAETLGANMEDWPGERWLDVRQPKVREIMGKRMDMAKSKGCDALEPDNVDGYSNKNGVGLTKQNQIDYNTALADMAHARGLKVALKNSTDLVSALVNKFDFAVVEECFAYDECDAYTPFVKQNKAVLNAEYTKFSSATCTKAKSLGLSTAFFNLDLNGKVFNPCP